LSEISFTFGKKKDIDKIMEFLSKNWKKDHILANNKELFEYEYLTDIGLNIGLANVNNKIVGIFGFKTYSESSSPDIAGSLWVISKECKIPFAGLKLREFVINNIPHNCFAAPGAVLDTMPIYKMLGVGWSKMNHFVLLNKTIKNFNIAHVPDSHILQTKSKFEFDKEIQIKEIESFSDIVEFNFPKYNIYYPYKDGAYLQKRFFEHPFYKYKVLAFYNPDTKIIKSLIVCREVQANEAQALSIVDFYGDENMIANLSVYFSKNLSYSKKYEYLDFLSLGISKDILIGSGFIDVNSNIGLIIPKYFEPFEKKNRSTYAVYDLCKNRILRQFKADGDQDRPNII